MLYRLAGVVSETLYTTKNISTLVVGRLPTKLIGGFFLIAASFATQTPNLQSDLVHSTLSGLPHIYSTFNPVITKGSDSKENLLKNNLSFEADVEIGSYNFGTGRLLANNQFSQIQTLETAEGKFNYTQKLRVFATSYDPFCSGCSDTTALGLKAGYGVIAVDPLVIPLGSKVYVPGYGVAIAGDTGGAIKGPVVDLGFDNVKNGWWSARFTDLYILAN